MILSVSARSISIQGLRLGSKTSGNPRKQIPEWMQIPGFQTTVTSALGYLKVV
jgi:hypothetical protein